MHLNIQHRDFEFIRNRFQGNTKEYDNLYLLILFVSALILCLCTVMLVPSAEFLLHDGPEDLKLIENVRVLKSVYVDKYGDLQLVTDSPYSKSHDYIYEIEGGSIFLPRRIATPDLQKLKKELEPLIGEKIWIRHSDGDAWNLQYGEKTYLDAENRFEAVKMRSAVTACICIFLMAVILLIVVPAAFGFLQLETTSGRVYPDCWEAKLRSLNERMKH